MFYSAPYSSPIGSLMLGSDGENMIGLWMVGQKYFGGTVTEAMTEKPNLPIFQAANQWLNSYFKGKRPPLSDLPLAPKGGRIPRDGMGDFM